MSATHCSDSGFLGLSQHATWFQPSIANAVSFLSRYIFCWIETCYCISYVYGRGTESMAKTVTETASGVRSCL